MLRPKQPNVVACRVLGYSRFHADGPASGQLGSQPLAAHPVPPQPSLQAVAAGVEQAVT